MNISPINLMAVASRLGSKTLAEVSEEDINFVLAKLEIEATNSTVSSIKTLVSEGDPKAVATVWLQKAYVDGSLANLVVAASGGYAWVRCPHCDLPFDVNPQLNLKE